MQHEHGARPQCAKIQKNSRMCKYTCAGYKNTALGAVAGSCEYV